MEIQFIIILLFFAGFISILVGLFIIPGFGVAEIIGLATIGLATYLAFTRLSPLWGTAALIITIVVIVALFIYFPKTSSWKQLRLSAQDKSHIVSANPELIDKEGETITMLRPAGTAKIDGKKVDVITEGVFIPQHTRIKVVAVTGNKVVVRKTEG
jgi:membrane-bound serine protease (ClpP class)